MMLERCTDNRGRRSSSRDPDSGEQRERTFTLCEDEGERTENLGALTQTHPRRS